MNNLHDLLAKLQSIEEAAKNSDIPAAHRKAKNPDGWWKTSLKDLEAEEKEGKISHPDNLAKNNGTKNEEVEIEEEFELDEVGEQLAPDTQGAAGAADESVTECGDMPMAGEGEGKVELSMSDLLKLMAHISKGQEPNVGGHDQPLMGDSYENEPEPEVAPVSAVLPTGNDMHSKGGEAEKVNGGGNPLQAQLAELYADIKARQLDELSKDTLKSYTKKAAADLNDKAYLSGHAYGKGKGDINREKKAFSRQAGIEKAVDKMSLKEANQLARNLRK